MFSSSVSFGWIWFPVFFDHLMFVQVTIVQNNNGCRRDGIELKCPLEWHPLFCVLDHHAFSWDLVAAIVFLGYHFCVFFGWRIWVFVFELFDLAISIWFPHFSKCHSSCRMNSVHDGSVPGWILAFIGKTSWISSFFPNLCCVFTFHRVKYSLQLLGKYKYLFLLFHFICYSIHVEFLGLIFGRFDFFSSLYMFFLEWTVLYIQCFNVCIKMLNSTIVISERLAKYFSPFLIHFRLKSMHTLVFLFER